MIGICCCICSPCTGTYISYRVTRSSLFSTYSQFMLHAYITSRRKQEHMYIIQNKLYSSRYIFNSKTSIWVVNGTPDRSCQQSSCPCNISTQHHPCTLQVASPAPWTETQLNGAFKSHAMQTALSTWTATGSCCHAAICVFRDEAQLGHEWRDSWRNRSQSTQKTAWHFPHWYT